MMFIEQTWPQLKKAKEKNGFVSILIYCNYTEMSHISLKLLGARKL
jgi:hypothetical protein